MPTALDLTKGSIAGHFRVLAIPIAVGMVFTTLYNVVDTFYAGFLSTQAQAGLAISFPIFFVLVAFGFGMNSALNALVGSAIGSKKFSKAQLIACQGISLAIISSVFIIFLGIFLLPFLLSIVSEPGEYRAAAKSYLLVLFFAQPGFLLAFTANGILGAQGDMKSMQKAQIFSFFANLVLNPLFIFGIPYIVSGIGFNGIAASTVVTQSGVMFYILVRAFRSHVMSGSSFYLFLPKLKFFLKITNQATPTCFTMIVMIFGSFFVQFFLKEFGPSAVAAYGIGLRIEQLILLPGFGLTGALLAITSQNFGAKKYDRVREAFWFSIYMAIILMIFGSILLWSTASISVAFFSEDEEVIRLGSQYLYVEGFILPIYVILFGLNAFLQGLQRPVWPLWIGVYRQGIGVFFFSWLLVRVLDMGTWGVWLGILVSVITGLIFASIVSIIVAKNKIGGLNKNYGIDILWRNN